MLTLMQKTIKKHKALLIIDNIRYIFLAAILHTYLVKSYLLILCTIYHIILLARLFYERFIRALNFSLDIFKVCINLLFIK